MDNTDPDPDSGVDSDLNKEVLSDIFESTARRLGQLSLSLVLGENEEKRKLFDTIKDFASRRKSIEDELFKKHGKVVSTFSLITGEDIGNELEETDSYQVSFCRPEIWDQLTPDEIAKLTIALIELYGIDPKSVHIGTWASDDENGLESEISFNIPGNDSDTVTQILILFNQESALDWEEKEKGGIIGGFAYFENKHYDESTTVDYRTIIESIGGLGDNGK